MYPSGKKTFVRELLDQVSAKLLDDVRHLPADWDGIEIRRWIADRFADQCLPMDRKRLKDYRRAVLTNNLDR